MDKRSNRYVLVSFCLLAQGVRVQSLVRYYPGVVEPVIMWLMQRGYNIWQMPCPELLFDDVYRRPCGKAHYDRPECDIGYTNSAQYLAQMCQRLEAVGNRVDLVLGVERSPSCAVWRLSAAGNRHGQSKSICGQGFFIDALRQQLQVLKHQPRFIGVDTLHIDATMKKLKIVVKEIRNA